MVININKDRYVINEHIEDKEIYSTKIVDKLPNDIDAYFYKYINGELVRAGLIPVKNLQDHKADKIVELEKFITSKRSQGIEYNNQLWSIDEECEKNLTSQITMLSFAPTEKVIWFSKSQANELTLDEFRELALTLSQAIANAKMQYYTYKNAIELAQTEEDINAITFE